MKTFIIFTILILYYCDSFAQSKDTLSNSKEKVIKQNPDTIYKVKPKIFTEEDYLNWLYDDKNNGKLVPWSLLQIENLKKTCLSEIKKNNIIVDCDCLVKNVSETINYSKYSELTEYQKGKATGTIIRNKCKQQH